MIWVAVASGLSAAFLIGALVGGRLCPSHVLEVDADEHGLGARAGGHSLGVTVHDGRVVLNLGTKVRFLSMDAQRAFLIALALRKAARSLRGAQKEKEPGCNPAPISLSPPLQ